MMKNKTKIFIGIGFVICLIGSNLLTYYLTERNEQKEYEPEAAALQEKEDEMTAQHEKDLTDLQEEYKKQLAGLEEEYAKLSEKPEEEPEKEPEMSAYGEEMLEAYEAFLVGEEINGAEYTYLDVGADSYPELHVRTEEEYVIYTYRDGEVIEFKRFEGKVTLYNGGVFMREVKDGKGVTKNNIFVLEPDGEILINMELLWQDKNGNGEADEEDRYEYNGVAISKEDWENQIDKYQQKETDEICWREVIFS